MSEYEQYDQASAHYDSLRVPIGWEIILGCLARCARRCGDVRLLDAGCGTGAYAAALIGHVRHIDALDISEGMLGMARRKLAGRQRQDRVSFYRASVTALPFADGHCDAVCFNQVLHHLDAEGCEEFPRLLRALKEAHRVLRPGGVVVINTCSHRQLAEAHWYLQLIPEACRRLRRRYITLDALEKMLTQCGFTLHGRIVPADALLLGEHYLDPEGPLKPNWRRGDSVWSLVSSDQLRRAEVTIRELSGRGELDSYVRRLDIARRDVGQITFCCASRPRA